MPQFTLYFGRNGDQLDPADKADAKEINEIDKLLPDDMPVNEHIPVELPERE